FSLAGSCHAGYFCDPGSTQPDPRHCPAGFYCPEGSEFPIPCSPGSFSPASGKGQAADCQLCPAGHSCSGPGAQTPELCPAGHFCLPGTTFSTEHPCPKGTFGPRAGATSESDCEPCPAGMYCSAPGLSQPSGFCYPGYHCAKGAVSPAPFKHRVRSSSPCPSDGIRGYRCPSGSYCPAGSALELPCEPGTFSPVPGASACLPCPAGTSCARAGT
ncbi:WBC30 protein, partial [Copsychus sechellarum]|nr:WBC30 protein [Copsychus sechellarum]